MGWKSKFAQQTQNNTKDRTVQAVIISNPKLDTLTQHLTFNKMCLLKFEMVRRILNGVSKTKFSYMICVPNLQTTTKTDCKTNITC